MVVLWIGTAPECTGLCEQIREQGTWLIPEPSQCVKLGDLSAALLFKASRRKTAVVSLHS